LKINEIFSQKTIDMRMSLNFNYFVLAIFMCLGPIKLRFLFDKFGSQFPSAKGGWKNHTLLDVVGSEGQGGQFCLRKVVETTS
tara:strand:+ start:10281 stop:10529 length:249 start_codon:yes stop_codon:yes gene_type:complete